MRGVAAVAVVVAFPALIAYATKTPVVPAPASAPDRLAFSGSELPRLGLSPGRQQEIKSLLNIRKPIKYGAYLWDDKGVPGGPVWIRVDLAAQTISVFRAGNEIGTAVILYGGDTKPTPAGTFTVIEKRQNHVSSLYDAAMPYTLRLTGDGISIHGGEVRKSAATHGCVGVPVGFARLLFDQAHVGDQVDIVSTTVQS